MSISRLFLQISSFRRAILVTLHTLLFVAAPLGFGQTELATVFGRVTDQSGAVVIGAEVEIRNVETNTATVATTNRDGLYSSPSLHPGHYVISVRKVGFRTVSATGLELNVQDNVVRNFALQVGSASESITVTADAGKLNTTDAAISTVVDRNFAENLPMNGRSFQTLIQLTPGVVVVPSTLDDSGQFSVNGQRSNSNYWTVDGVSANFGVNTYVAPGNGIGGTLGAFSALGGTNSLVSVDALQEFRIQTSTYAPEFGRTPGAQISIVTRSGTNQFHGSAFDYLRNDVLDANDWFANHAGLPKAQERQNDFGGAFSGPVQRDKTFFFFSYEGLRLRLPETALTTVPDVASRQRAPAEIQPFLSSFPRPNGTELGSGIASFDSTFSNRGTLDAYSIRVDHTLNSRVTSFGRYSYSPSELVERGPNSDALSDLSSSRITTQTATVGATLAISPSITNDLRFNYSRANGSSHYFQDTFGGATPLASAPFPAPFTNGSAQFSFTVFALAGSQYSLGNSGSNIQRQFNLVNNFSIQKGSHAIKTGVDFRYLSPVYNPYRYNQSVFFGDVTDAESGNLLGSIVASGNGTTLALSNLGTFAQDTWHIVPRLTLTYGLRWDVDFAPATSAGPHLPSVAGYNLNDLSKLTLLPSGGSPFKTSYGNIAPRVGVAYQLSNRRQWGTVIRGGFGVFYDLEDGELGAIIGSALYPFSASNLVFGGTFPLNSAAAAPPPIAAPGGGAGQFAAFDPRLRAPYTLQWNVALEQALGTDQVISASYVGAAGRRLSQTAFVNAPNPSYAAVMLVGSTATSDYDALQLQYTRRLTRGLQAIASYTWSHSIDTGSAGSAFGNLANAAVPGINPSANRGPSDFDIRSAMSAGTTYDLPVLKTNKAVRPILSGWSIQNMVQFRSAPPVNVFEGQFSQLFNGDTEVRPDVVAGQSFYLFGTQYPGGRAINPAAFASPPTDSSGNPVRQGDLGRNALRGFGAVQWDFAVHRDFVLRDSLKLQFRAELFNVLNRPNFAQPLNALSDPRFGQSTEVLSQSLGGANLGNGGFDPLYQLGGPRSIQFALKVLF